MTHTAMSSTRVMATCALLGQAAGTAAAIALREGITPREVYTLGFVPELQQTLMEDDCYLPFRKRALTSLDGRMRSSISDMENAEALRSGVDRAVGEATECRVGAARAVLRNTGWPLRRKPQLSGWFLTAI